MKYQHLYSDTLSRNKPNIIREIAKKMSIPGFISFAGGNPDVNTFPVEQLQEIASSSLMKNRVAAFQYGTTEGNILLREWISGWLEEKGIKALPSNIMLTTGSQQGIDLCGKVFVNPGDKVLVEDPTYLATIQILKVYNAAFQTIHADSNGMSIDSLREVVARGNNKLLYTVPTFQNPTGRTMSRERREQILEILRQNDFIMIEDDPYSELRYSGEEIVPVKSYDNDGRIIYLGSFSKVIAPGLRTGFVVADEEILRRMAVGKQTADLHSNTLSQVLIYEFVRQGLLDEHLEKIKSIYKAKRDKMLSLMEQHFPKEAKFEKPDGGMFIWVTLPEEIDTTELLQKTMEEKVAFIPGNSFYALGGGSNTMRLNFSNSDEEKMQVGIAKLGQLIKNYIR